MQTSEARNIKSELHHWWPQSLFKFWSTHDGVVNQIFCDGKIIAHTSPKNLGAKTNAHIIKLASTPTVWDENFEDKFDAIDSRLPFTVQSLEDLRNTVTNKKTGGFTERFHSCDLSQKDLDLLIECMLSLVVRSPRFRNSIEVNTNYYRNRSGAPLPPANLALINLNLRDALKRFIDYAKGRGKFALLFSEDKEFIFGDGFYQNYTSSVSSPITPRMLLPLTPNLCVFYNLATRYSSNRRAALVTLNSEEVNFINRTTQIYSCKSVFYKTEQPELHDEFHRQEFLEYVAGQHPAWLESLSSELSAY